MNVSTIYPPPYPKDAPQADDAALGYLVNGGHDEARKVLQPKFLEPLLRAAFLAGWYAHVRHLHKSGDSR